MVQVYMSKNVLLIQLVKYFMREMCKICCKNKINKYFFLDLEPHQKMRTGSLNFGLIFYF